MADQAKVTSLDALEDFRACLILFLAKARSCVDAGGDEIRRTRGWLQNEQRLRWQGEIRRIRRKLDLAEQELLTARMSLLRDNVSREMMAVRRTKQALAEAEEKLRLVKLWSRNYESSVAPLAKKLESFRSVLDHEMPKAISYLVQTQNALEAYTETAGSPRGLQSPAPADEPLPR